MIQKIRQPENGFTLVELVVCLMVLSIVALCVLGLFTSLVSSALLSKRKAVALSLATNQIEYLKSLPYNNLAVAGGSIYSTTPLPATSTTKINGVNYLTVTSIDYIDDAYDGCGSYPNLVLKQTYCRNYPPPASAPATDTNPADYKIIHVSVFAPSTVKLAEVDTQVSARVAETASTTGALFVSVIDDSGTPVSGALVQVNDVTLSPNVTVSDSTDSNGTAIFYGLPPDSSNYNYVINGTNNGYSSLTTISPNGALTPTYSSQKVVTQLSSFVTLTLKPQGPDSLLVETTSTAGTALGGVKLYVKGGYKKYTLTTDTAYYYDNLNPSDTRPVTDASGNTTLSNLVPGQYIFCGDIGSIGCAIGNTTYYLAAAVPYSGTNPFNPITVPTYAVASPPVTTFAFGGKNYYQKVRLMLTTNSSYPRVTTLAPDDASQSGGTIGAFVFQINGANLPCNAVANSCSTTVKFLQGSNTYTSSCTGNAAGLILHCTVNLTGASIGLTQMTIISGGNTLTMPASPLIGGINVTP